MKDSELTTQLASRLSMEKEKVDEMLLLLSETIGDLLVNNSIVSLHGFGQFESKKKSERISVNPTNKKRYLIPPKLVPVFKPIAPMKLYLKTLENNE